MELKAPVFGPQSSKYIFACGYHVTTVLKVLCIFDVIMGFAHAAITEENIRLIMFITISIFSLIALSPFIAIKYIRPKWMLPYLILSGFSLFCQIFLIVDFIWSHFAGKAFVREDRVINLSFMEIGIGGFGFIIAYRCYQYLSEIEKSNRVMSFSNVQIE